MFLFYKRNYLLAGNILYTTCTGQDEFLPVLTAATRHEDVNGSEDTAPRILIFGTRWRGIVKVKVKVLP